MPGEIKATPGIPSVFSNPHPQLPSAPVHSLSAQLHRFSRLLVAAELVILVAITPILIFADRLFWPMVGVIGLLEAARWRQTGRLARPAPTSLLLVVLALLLPLTYTVSVTPDLTRASLGYLVAGLALYQGVINWTVNGIRLGWLVVILLTVVSLLAAVSPLLVKDLAEQGANSFLPPFLRSLSQRLPEHVNANVMAGTLAIWLPLAVVMAVYPCCIQVRHRPLMRGVALTSSALILAAILMLSARGVWLALAVAACLGAVLRWPRLLRLTPLALALGWLGMAQGWHQALARAMFSQDALGGFAVRVDIWSRGLTALRDFALTGMGMGSWGKLGPLLYPTGLIATSQDVPHVHNLLLQVGVDLGVVGLAAYAGLLLLSFSLTQIARRRFLAVGIRDLAAVSLAVWTGMAVMLVHGLLDAVSWSSKPAVLAWIMMALAITLYLFSEERPA